MVQMSPQLKSAVEAAGWLGNTSRSPDIIKPMVVAIYELESSVTWKEHEASEGKKIGSHQPAF